MLIYKKNCSKIIKIGTFFYKNLRGRRKKGCCLRKGLPPPPTIETCLFKKTTLLCGFKRTQHTFFRLWVYQIKIQQGNREFK